MSEKLETGLQLMRMAQEVGIKLAPCGCLGVLPCAICQGTGVQPKALTLLYKLASDAADIAHDAAYAQSEHELGVAMMPDAVRKGLAN